MYKPTTLSLYLTQYCPLSCKYCIFGTKKKDHMPTEYALTRINEAYNLGVPHVVFTGGEPTLHPDFLEIFREVKKQEMSTLLVTNGISIKKEVLKEFTEYDKSSFYLSLDCYDKKINDKYRDKNAFKFVIKSIKSIRNVNKNKFIGINSILVKETLQLLPKTADFILNKLNANVLNVERVIRIGNSEKMPDEIIIDDLNEYFRIITNLSQKYGAKFQSYTCDLRSCLLDNPDSFNILVFPDKNMYLCCNLPDKRIKIGDESTTFKEVIKAENIRKTANIFNKHFFRNQDKIRSQKGIFGCVECVEEYKKLRDFGELPNLINQNKKSLFC